MLAAFISLIAAFGGGVLGASIGALPAFIMTGVVAAAGGILSCAGIPEISELLVNNIAFGPFLGPHVCFAGGVAAAAYAKQIGKTENGADIALALNGLGDSLVLVVGGLFGMLGYIIAGIVNGLFALTPFYTDNPGCTVFISAVIVRLLFGTRGMYSAPGSRRFLSKGSRLSNTLLLSFAYSLAVSGVYVALALQGYASQLGSYHIVIFGLAAIGLLFAEFGQAYFGWHHIGIISAEAVMCGWTCGLGAGALILGIIFGVLAGIIGDIEGNLLNTDVDSHIDPPATAIFICTILISIVYVILG
ncbi:hypothetical protein B5E53_15525 [Eubacterium sp. An11]|uniref:hypothetical protein n=1 Tax=Eubacterium sp. An11 TaxID=1965542 RepID=UPI000B379F6E|nr:hypothetical protein [Eubacterium sp. An11]OUQ63673.1 hypothetical protein B5E53_15525 [Eubacterium sp. An11]